MKNGTLIIVAAIAIVSLSGCKMLGKSKKGKDLPNDGQLYGVAPAKSWTLPKPPGMVYIPPGTFHMGPSDEDVNYAYTARNKQVSISGFWMDATEVTNNEYRQFTNWVRDSIAATLMGFVRQAPDGNQYVDWKKAHTIKWSDKATLEKIDAMILTPDNRIFNKKELDPTKMKYRSETFDYKEASKPENALVQRSKFIRREEIQIYPDTLCWVRDFAYAYNEPMAKKYFGHPAFGNYPGCGC
jgi:hypothetical protein